MKNSYLLHVWKFDFRLYPTFWELSFEWDRSGWFVVGPIDIAWDFS